MPGVKTVLSDQMGWPRGGGDVVFHFDREGNPQRWVIDNFSPPHRAAGVEGRVYCRPQAFIEDAKGNRVVQTQKGPLRGFKAEEIGLRWRYVLDR